MNDITFKPIFIRHPIDKKSEDWCETSFQWKVVINNQSFDYYTGSGLTNDKSEATEPTLDDVLYSLLSDSEALNMSFNDWCDTFGHSNDSIKAQQLYFACQQNGEKLIKTGIDIAHHRERLQDY